MTEYIAYVTRDETNADFARQVSLPLNIAIRHTQSEDELPNIRLLGIVYDLDHMWDDERRRLTEKPCTDRPPLQTAVHTYNIDDERAEQLRLAGIAVYRQVCADIFQTLAGVAESERRAA